MTEEELKDLGEHIAGAIENDVRGWKVAFNELTIEVNAARIVSVLKFLREDVLCRFIELIDITAVDWPERAKRFDVVYHLLSLHNNSRIRVKAQIGEDETMPTAIEVHPCANWFEREVFDMYGIVFSGHPDMRRILTDYGFEGFPLRKDFPLTGHLEVRYDDQEKRVVYEPVSLVQDFRNFDYLSPWEGAKYVLPGDEKAKS
ncbi:MAG: NADH-quinone oxidoreductase subunit C [Alphaproteobacteria bacterium]|nr:NADH-quinone oxidoreductase subunit C [Alphaproteobacteria bacterium]